MSKITKNENTKSRRDDTLLTVDFNLRTASDAIPIKSRRDDTLISANEYKGYLGSIEYGKDDNRLYGSVIGMTKDCITYEGNTIDELKIDFINAIESYLEGCDELGIKPHKGLSVFPKVKNPTKIEYEFA